MKNIIINAVIILFPLIMTGCSTPYMVDRGRDGADIFTGTVGTGLGAKGRVGPLSTGLFVNRDNIGLRAGTLFKIKDDEHKLEAFDFTSIIPKPYILPIFVEERLYLGEISKSRHKDYRASGIIPFWVEDASEWSYYTQIETAIAIGGSLRMGFNVGEMLDFMLGWTTLDIYGDDIGIIEEKENNESNPKDASNPSSSDR